MDIQEVAWHSQTHRRPALSINPFFSVPSFLRFGVGMPPNDAPVFTSRNARALQDALPRQSVVTINDKKVRKRTNFQKPKTEKPTVQSIQ